MVGPSPRPSLCPSAVPTAASLKLRRFRGTAPARGGPSAVPTAASLKLERQRDASVDMLDRPIRGTNRGLIEASVPAWTR